MTDKARAELASTGVLRAGINLSNFLLVTGRTEKAEPVGVAPDMAKEIAASLGVPVTYVTFKSPGELSDQAGKNCLLYTSPSPRDRTRSRMPSSA